MNHSNITDAVEDRGAARPPFISKLRRKTPVREEVIIQTEGIVSNEQHADRALTMSRKSAAKSGARSGTTSHKSQDELRN